MTNLTLKELAKEDPFNSSSLPKPKRKLLAASTISGGGSQLVIMMIIVSILFMTR